MKGLLNIIQTRFAKFEVAKKPDLKAKDTVRVQYEHKGIAHHKTYIMADPILNYEGKWVCPVLIYECGVVYADCECIELIRRVNA